MRGVSFWSIGSVLICASFLSAQEMTVTGNVAFAGRENKSKADMQNVVLWLTPADGSSVPAVPPASPRPRLVQKDKSFEPHVLVVPVGTLVQFPNRDPFFHNVFSLFEGKRFDLGLYEAGSTRDVLFDKSGVSYIFCNIHAEMSAVVIALATPYYAISNRRGTVTIPRVPPGRYTLHTWYETAVPETLNSMTRDVTISESSPRLGQLQLPAPTQPQSHKNMYGKDYPPPAPESPVYEHP
jgi:plastocyanin